LLTWLVLYKGPLCGLVVVLVVHFCLLFTPDAATRTDTEGSHYSSDSETSVKVLVSLAC